MNTLEEKHWFLISDLASVVEMFTKNLSVLTVLGLVLIFGTIWVLWHTRFGLRLRSCGEAPAAAESLGVNVYRYKFIAVLVSGRARRSGWRLPRAGLVLGLPGRPDRWPRLHRPGGDDLRQLAARSGLFLGSTLFGYTQALPFRQGTVSLHALLLVVAALLLAVAIFQWRRGGIRRRCRPRWSSRARSSRWYLLTDEVPREFTPMAPYITTLLVLAFASQRLRMPAADGQVYRKGSAG